MYNTLSKTLGLGIPMIIYIFMLLLAKSSWLQVDSKIHYVSNDKTAVEKLHARGQHFWLSVAPLENCLRHRPLNAAFENTKKLHANGKSRSQKLHENTADKKTADGYITWVILQWFSLVFCKNCTPENPGGEADRRWRRRTPPHIPTY